MLTGIFTGGAGEMTHYKWTRPYDWMADTARSWDKKALYHYSLTLAQKADPDDIQELFQQEMDEDGYFEPIE